MANCGTCNHREVCRCFPNPEEYCSDYEPDRPHGKWIDCMYTSGCSVCKKEIRHGFSFVRKEYRFCPNCGAKMISSNSEIEKSKSAICPCIECCEIDNSEPCRKGCSEYKKWKEGGAE